MAKPTSAFLSAGPSLVPSPVTATTCRCSVCVLSMMPVGGAGVCSGPWDALASADPHTSSLASGLCPATPPLWFFPAPGLPIAPRPVGDAGYLSSVLVCSPPQSRPAHLSSTLSSLCSSWPDQQPPWPESPPPACAPGVPGFCQGPTVGSPSTTLWEVQSHLRRSGLCHLPVTSDPPYWP